MGKGLNILFGILGIVAALAGFIFALVIGLTASISYELFNFIMLIIFGLAVVISAIYSFKGKKWAKFGVLISFVVILIILYNLFSMAIELFLL